MSFWQDALVFLGFRDAAPEARAAHTLKEVDFWLRDADWGTTTAAGISVTDPLALTVPEVHAAVQLVSGDVGRCPLKLQRHNDGEWIDDPGHDLWEILHDLPNPETTAQTFWSSLVADLLTVEHAYAEIVRDGVGRVVQLWRLNPERMSVERDPATLRKRYTYRLPKDERKTWVFDANRPPLLDLEYASPIRRCRDLIGLAVAIDTYIAKFFANGARPGGILSTPKTLTDGGRERLTAAWRAAYSGAANAHKVAVLEDDLKFQAMAQDNDAAQLLELRKFVRTQIAGTFKVPPHKVGDLERATFSNIEQQDREYVSTALAPLFANLAQAIRRDLLTTRQYPRMRAQFDYEALIQTDIQSRMTAFATARQNGIFSADDCRRKLGENPIGPAQGGDRYHMNGNMVPLTGAPAPTAPADPPTPRAPVETSADAPAPVDEPPLMEGVA